jgi:DNA modification methylase
MAERAHYGGGLVGKEILGSLELNRIYQRDCIEGMRMLPDKSIDLIVIDPPYNIGKDKRWDKWKTVDEYVEWMALVFKECERVLKSNGSFYWFHNDVVQIRKLMGAIDTDTMFIYKQFIVWDKFNGTPWNQLKAITHSEDNRNYPKLAEYCVFYTLQGVNSDYERRSYILKPFIDYMNEIKRSFNVSHEVIGKHFGYSDGGKKWFRYDQPRLLDREKYEKLQEIYPQFNRNYDDIYEESVKRSDEYESRRYTFNVQKTHSSVWQYAIPEQNGHITPKPVEMIENIIRHSSNEGDVVLDCFMGSGTTAEAAVHTGRKFIGFEREPEYIEIANKRLDNELEAE